MKTLNVILKLQERAQKIRVKGDRAFNPSWHAARDTRFMLRTSEIIVRSALERKESRGAHWRLDYPQEDPYWAKHNVIVSCENGRLVFSHRPVPEIPPEYQKLLSE
jgi:succinate dehydrogenase / fumarate reductase flavoprotein subunit